MTEKPKSATVLADHVAIYSDPVEVKSGKCVRLTGRQDVWDGYVWLWAVAADGREGWIPDNAIKHVHGNAVITEDYSAKELSVDRGEVVVVFRRNHGWAWCGNEKGAQGWVPLRALKLSN